MFSALTRLAFGYSSMLAHAFTHGDGLQRGWVRAALVRQIHLTGITALPIVALIAICFGAFVPTRALLLLGPDNVLALKSVVWGGIRELGPLAVALIMVARSSVAIATEVALMGLRDDIADSAWQDAAHDREVVLPRVLGLSMAAAMLVSYFQVIAVVAALLSTTVVLNTPLSTEIDNFLSAVSWWQVPISLLKGAVFGAGIAVISCFHGLHAERRVGAIPKAAVAACVGSMVYVLLVDIIAASLLLV